MACNANTVCFDHMLRMLRHHHQDKDLSKLTLVDICGTDNPSIINNIPRETFDAQVDAMKRKLGLPVAPSEAELAEREATRDERQAARAKWDEDVARIKAQHLAERLAEQDAARAKREAEAAERAERRAAQDAARAKRESELAERRARQKAAQDAALAKRDAEVERIRALKRPRNKEEQLVVNAVSSKDRREAEKAAKPSRNTGRWTAEEHDEFLKCLDIYGREWKKAAERITTRTAAQIRSHAEKYFQKIEAAGETVPAKKARKIEAPVRSSGRARTAPKKMDV